MFTCIFVCECIFDLRGYVFNSQTSQGVIYTYYLSLSGPQCIYIMMRRETFSFGHMAMSLGLEFCMSRKGGAGVSTKVLVCLPMSYHVGGIVEMPGSPISSHPTKSVTVQLMASESFPRQPLII